MGVEREPALEGRLTDGQQRARILAFADQLGEPLELAGVGQAGREVDAERKREVAEVGLVEPSEGLGDRKPLERGTVARRRASSWAAASAARPCQ